MLERETLKLAPRLMLMLKGQNVKLNMVMEDMANTAKRLLEKLPTMYLYLPQLMSLLRFVYYSATIDLVSASFNWIVMLWQKRII